MSFFEGGPPQVAGHRGDPHVHPDNTLAGVMSGLAVVGAVEVDIRLSSDGHLVLSHDPFIGHMEIATTPWPALAEADVGDGHPPCLLDEVVALGGRLDLEVKNLPSEPGFDPDGRLALMVAARAGEDDIVTSFYWPDIDRVLALAPGITTGLLVSERGSADDALRHAIDRGHSAIAPHHTLVTPDLCAKASGFGIPVVTWTVNTITDAGELYEQGVTAIISDHPRLISSAFREEAP